MGLGSTFLPSSALGMTGLMGGLPLEPSKAPPNWLPSLRRWTLWYFLMVDLPHDLSVWEIA